MSKCFTCGRTKEDLDREGYDAEIREMDENVEYKMNICGVCESAMGATGFEPTLLVLETSWLPNYLIMHPNRSDRTRTGNQWIYSPPLYP